MSEPSADEEDLSLLSPEERDRRKKFEQKRKMHYNEFYAVKMARQLMEQVRRCTVVFCLPPTWIK